MRTSLNPLMYNTKTYSKLFEVAGTYELLLSPGTYYVAMCGGGGAGGSRGENSADAQQGGAGGCGGSATVVERTILIPVSMMCTVSVGNGGRTSANGGNGGVGGAKGGGNAGGGGAGGGGGMPTYIQFAQPIDNSTYISSDGGGGGGGGGGASVGGRYAYGAGGGGGGGRYILSNGTIVSESGKNGAIGGTTTSGGHVNGRNGIDGFDTSVNYTSGKGGSTYEGTGGAGATGLGASGASGAGGKYNDASGWQRPGGGGGGGTGGSLTAGGGAGGAASGEAYNAPGGNASNYRTTPIQSVNYLGQPSTLGMGGMGQTNTQPATNGYNGWFYILKFQESTPLDLGEITGATDNTFDCGGITDPVEDVLEMGQIA